MGIYYIGIMERTWKRLEWSRVYVGVIVGNMGMDYKGMIGLICGLEQLAMYSRD